MLGIIIYSLVFNYMLHRHDVHIYGDFSLTARVASLFIAFCINFPIGFVLSSYIVFPESQIHGRVQLFRYSAATLSFILLSYVLTKVFAVAIPLVRADVANIFVSMITAVLSYLSQRFFTFKVTKQEVMDIEAEFAKLEEEAKEQVSNS